MDGLWEHQREGVARAVAAIERCGGFMLAFEMGTGKSRTALAVARELGARDVLVVCPKSVIPVWGLEVEKTGGGWPVTYVRGTREARQRLAGARGVVVVNYEAAWRTPALSDRSWDLVVFDECHRLALASGKASRWAAKIAEQVPARLGLSGTPTPHSPLQAWPTYRALTPHSPLGLRTWTEFRARYTRPASMNEWRDRDLLFRKGRGGELVREKLHRLDELAARMDPLTMRVRASEVLDLPPALDVVRTVELEPSARRVYRELERDLIASLGERGEEVTAANAMVAVLRLAQVTGGTVRDDAGVEHQVSTAKREALAELLDDASDEPIVVFGRFHSDLDAIHASVGSRRSYELSGRKHELEAWQEDDGPSVLVVQPQAGGLGVDLTRARICCFFSVGWSLSEWLQARARVHRPGQTRSVEYVTICAAGTVDEEVMRALERREDVVNHVLNSLQSRHGSKRDVRV